MIVTRVAVKSKESNSKKAEWWLVQIKCSYYKGLSLEEKTQSPCFKVPGQSSHRHRHTGVTVHLCVIEDNYLEESRKK